MKFYRIEMMNNASFHNYMCGGNNYRVDYYDVEANNVEQALAIAKQDNPNYHINAGFVSEITEKYYTTSEKDKLIAHIADLEKELETAKNKLRELEKRD
jgi:uncharacterized protein with von Willebrand factor type A (vWA) domain